MSERKQIVGLLLISTGKYQIFVQPLIDSVKKNFLRSYRVNIHLFTDDIREYIGDERVVVIQHKIPSYKWPFATLYRYRIFDEHKEEIKEDYVFYSDVDMRIDGEVGGVILMENLVVIYHPGFYTVRGWGDHETTKDSLAYLDPKKRKKYVAGGFNGGKREYFMKMCNILNSRITDDENRGVIARWNDESHLNWLINSGETGIPYFILDPSYCMVEQQKLRELWGIDHLPVKIIALAKNHEEVRE